VPLLERPQRRTRLLVQRRLLGPQIRHEGLFQRAQLHRLVGRRLRAAHCPRLRRRHAAVHQLLLAGAPTHLELLLEEVRLLVFLRAELQKTDRQTNMTPAEHTERGQKQRNVRGKNQ